jgi:hypothetical protein
MQLVAAPVVLTNRAARASAGKGNFLKAFRLESNRDAVVSDDTCSGLPLGN